jgi:hypothetical protein
MCANAITFQEALLSRIILKDVVEVVDARKGGLTDGRFTRVIPGQANVWVPVDAWNTLN